MCEQKLKIFLSCPIGVDCLEFDNPNRIAIHEKIVGKPCPSDPADRVSWIFEVIAKYKMLWTNAMIKELGITEDTNV